MNIYKKGFKMTVKETVLRGEAVYEVYLRARYDGTADRGDVRRAQEFVRRIRDKER